VPVYKSVNKDFFKIWTREMAYVLGFFSADGYITINKRGGQFWCIQITDKKLLATGYIVALGLLIHNFPEGMAVFLSSFTDLKLGVLLAIAIAIHNIPEGIAVAAPIYHATLDKRKAIKYAFISGSAEPIGAIIAYFLLKPHLNQNILAYVFSLVAGIMVYISFDELLPACFRDGQGHKAILGVISGMIMVFFSLLFL